MRQRLVDRRRVIQGALAGGALLWARPWATVLGSASTSFAAPLHRPVELTSPHITLQAGVAEVPVLAGPPTRMWTFGGSFPGPTIRRPSGERTRLTIEHRLPAEVGTLTIHHHGGHQEALHDGGPSGPPIEVGAIRTYVYELREDGEPERGAMQWYHDHSHHRTGRNTWMGLLGLFVVEDGLDEALGLPVGDHDLLLVLSDRRFDTDNQLVDPFTAPDREETSPLEAVGSGWPPGDEVTGDVFLVNGVNRPYIDVEARRYRLRILNASNFRVFDVALSDGRPLAQVGTESGLLPAPIIRSSVPLGPGERAEVIVDFTGLSDNTVQLIGLPSPSTTPRTEPTGASFMEFRVGADAPSLSPPSTLRPLPGWVHELSEVPDRAWVFSLGIDSGGRTTWTINGLAFDPDRVDARPELGSTETWLLVNAGPVAVSHYIHIHDVDWKVLARNATPPDGAEAGLKETFRLDPGETLLIGTKFTDHLGRFMLHCHMLEHEDHGMMTTFEVVAPGEGDRPVAHHADPDPVGQLVGSTTASGTAPIALDVVDAVRRYGQPAPISVLTRHPLPNIEQSLICDLDAGGPQ